MTTTIRGAVMVPCPVCGTRFAWPPTDRCASCRADLLGPLAATYWQLARDEVALHERQAELVQQLTSTAIPVAPVPPPVVPPPPRPRHRLTDLRAQTVLGVAGAALLAVAAVVFAAVTWQDLPAIARAAVLVGAAGSAITLSLWLDRRTLHVTASAVGLLADSLVATVVWASHTYGATGDLSNLGGASLAAFGAVVVALGLGRRGVRWQPGAATVAWLGAVALAGFAVAELTPPETIPAVMLAASLTGAAPHLQLAEGSPVRRALRIAGAVGLVATSASAPLVLAATDGVATLWPLTAGLVATLLWLRLGGTRIGTGAATATASALAIGGLATFDLADATLIGGIAVVAVAVTAAATVAGPRRLPMLVGSAPVTLPALAATLALVRWAAIGWVQHLAAPWQEAAPAAPDPEPWFAAAALATAGVVAMGAAGLHLPRWRAVAAVALPVTGTAAVWQVGGHVTTLVAVAAVGALAGFVRADATNGRATLVAWSVVAVGWAMPSSAISAVVAAAVAAVALGAVLAPVGRSPEQSAVAVVAAALATAALAVRVLGPVAAGEVAGVLAVTAMLVVAGAGRRLALHGVVTAAAASATATVATVVAVVATDAVAGARVAGTVAVGALLLALAWRHDRVSVLVHAATAFVAATVTSALLLHAADVTTPEAYTAVPAALALGAGVGWMVRDPTVRSRRALHPGLVLAVMPTAVLLVADPQDTARAVATACLAAVALLVGVGRRVEAPVWYGAAAAAVVTLTQLAVVAGHVPRWVVFAVLGALLVAASATFERQRVRARRWRERVDHVATTYR